MEATRDNAAASGSRPLGRRACCARRRRSRASRSTTCSVSSCCRWAPGGPARHLLGGARTQHTTLLAPDLGPGVTLCAPLASLPFASDSIDAILLPHTLELVEDPYAVLREAERVLCAEGCLMICGFNPCSGWGARRLFCAATSGGRRSRRDTRRMLSERRLRDWMALLDFEVAERLRLSRHRCR